MKLSQKIFILWVDADACPKTVKEVIYKFCNRLQFKVIFVANSQMYVPPSPLIEFVKVKKDLDAADHYIVEHLRENDIVITADIPLAALVVSKNAIAIDIRGEVYTEENINERLAMRDYIKGLRDSGMQIGGPQVFDEKDKVKFTNAFNRILDKKFKKSSP